MNSIRDLNELRRLVFISNEHRAETLRLFLLMVMGAFAEFAIIIAIVPFLASIADPASAESTLPVRLVRSSIWRSADPISASCLLLAAVALGSAIVRLLLLRASQKYVLRIGLDLSCRTYGAVLHQPLPFHLSANSSAVLNAVQASATLTGGFLLPVMQALVATVLSFFIVTAMILVSPWAALLLVAVAIAVYGVVALLLGATLRQSGEAIASNQAMRLKAVQEGIGGIRDILIGGAQAVYLQAYERHSGRLRTELVRAALAATAPRQVVESIGVILVAILAILVVRNTHAAYGALPALGALAMGAQKLLPLFGQIFNG